MHAISLAHFSLTVARGVAANGVNERIRLQAEVDRLRQEVALLGEELRIKDARMLRIPAQRRPHQAPTEWLAILELRAARGWSTAETARRCSAPATLWVEPTFELESALTLRPLRLGSYACSRLGVNEFSRRVRTLQVFFRQP